MIALKVDKAYLLGFSQGGAIALLTAVEHPEMVRALVLSNSSVEFARRYYEKNQVTEVKQPVEKAGSLSL